MPLNLFILRVTRQFAQCVRALRFHCLQGGIADSVSDNKLSLWKLLLTTVSINPPQNHKTMSFIKEYCTSGIDRKPLYTFMTENNVGFIVSEDRSLPYVVSNNLHTDIEPLGCFDAGAPVKEKIRC